MCKTFLTLLGRSSKRLNLFYPAFFDYMAYLCKLLFRELFFDTKSAYLLRWLCMVFSRLAPSRLGKVRLELGNS